jgi:hypothetical protein
MFGFRLYSPEDGKYENSLRPNAGFRKIVFFKKNAYFKSLDKLKKVV